MNGEGQIFRQTRRRTPFTDWGRLALIRLVHSTRVPLSATSAELIIDLMPRHHQHRRPPGADTNTPQGEQKQTKISRASGSSVSEAFPETQEEKQKHQKSHQAAQRFMGGTKPHLVAPFAPPAVREPPRGAPFPGDSCRRRPAPLRAKGLHRFQQLRRSLTRTRQQPRHESAEVNVEAGASSISSASFSWNNIR